MSEAAQTMFHGVTLAKFAFVRAGLGDGLALDELLAFFDIDPVVWELADEAWDDRVLDAVGDVDAVFLDELAARTAEARTHWTRRVPPLDDDLRAWLELLHAMANDAEPETFLARMRLGAADVAHLHRLWSERMQKDAKLRADALTLLAEERRAPPVPDPQPPRLVRAPVGPAPGASVTAEIPFAKARTLPFEEGEPAPMPPPLAVPLPRRPRPRVRTPGLDETRLERPGSAGPPLPFAAPQEGQAPAIAAAMPTAPEPQEPVAAPVVLPLPAPVAAAMAPPEVALYAPAAAARTVELPPAETTLVLAPAQVAPGGFDPNLDETTAIHLGTGKVIPLAEAFGDATTGGDELSEDSTGDAEEKP